MDTKVPGEQFASMLKIILSEDYQNRLEIELIVYI